MNNRIQKRIIQEAIQSFMMYGVKRTSMDMIATSLQISKRTLYEFFPGKDELLRNAILYMIEKTKESIATIEERCDSSLEIILAINEAMLQQALQFCPAFYKDIKHYQDVLDIIDGEFKEFIYGRLSVACSCAVKEGHVIKDYSFEFLFSFFENNLFSFYSGRNIPPEGQLKIFRYTIQVYLSGICTDDGRDFLKRSVLNNETIIKLKTK